MAERIAVIAEPDPVVGDALVALARECGFEATGVRTHAEALEVIEGGGEGGDVAVALIDVSDERDGMAFVERVSVAHPAVGVVVLSAYATVASAVGALRAGAVDLVSKPLVDGEVRAAIDRAARHYELDPTRGAGTRRARGPRTASAGVIGNDPRMRRVQELVEAVAPSRTTVLMTGESGTGKSMTAQQIHASGPRADRAFVELACGSIPETLLESELFGHSKGAFTGAHADKPGRFLAADGGTIFLDEINSASPAMQLKLLRVLQERRFEPVGSNETVEVDARVILATNQPLEALVADGRFRQDLYYRVNVVQIDLPPLRERRSDIPELAEAFLRAQEAELGRTFAGFSGEAMDALLGYAFPGNVRELANIVERAAVLCRGQTVSPGDLPDHVVDAARSGPGGAMGSGLRLRDEGGAATGAAPVGPLAETLREAERGAILRALESCAWNRQQSAEVLGINRTTLYKKIKALGIELDGRLAG
ncbi:MAG: sigma-54 dependent transcriptional regulator [Planctomycetota bacterium]